MVDTIVRPTFSLTDFAADLWQQVSLYAPIWMPALLLLLVIYLLFGRNRPVNPPSRLQWVGRDDPQSSFDRAQDEQRVRLARERAKEINAYLARLDRHDDDEAA